MTRVTLAAVAVLLGTGTAFASDPPDRPEDADSQTDRDGNTAPGAYVYRVAASMLNEEPEE